MVPLSWLSDGTRARNEPHVPDGQPRIEDGRAISFTLNDPEIGCRRQEMPFVSGCIHRSTTAATGVYGAMSASACLPGSQLHAPSQAS